MRTATSTEHDRVVRAFGVAARSGDLNALIAALDPKVELLTDGGGVVTAARNPVHGADRVARFILGVSGKRAGLRIGEHQTHDGLGLTLWHEGRVIGVITFVVRDGAATSVRMALNPEKLSRWG